MFNRPADVYNLLFEFSDRLGGNFLREAHEYNITVEPEVLVNSVIVLMEKELESMDLTKN